MILERMAGWFPVPWSTPMTFPQNTIRKFRKMRFFFFSVLFTNREDFPFSCADVGAPVCWLLETMVLPPDRSCLPFSATQLLLPSPAFIKIWVTAVGFSPLIFCACAQHSRQTHQVAYFSGRLPPRLDTYGDCIERLSPLPPDL